MSLRTIVLKDIEPTAAAISACWIANILDAGCKRTQVITAERLAQEIYKQQTETGITAEYFAFLKSKEYVVVTYPEKPAEPNLATLLSQEEWGAYVANRLDTGRMTYKVSGEHPQQKDVTFIFCFDVNPHKSPIERQNVAFVYSLENLCIGGPLHGMAYISDNKTFTVEVQRGTGVFDVAPHESKLETVSYCRNHSYPGIAVWTTES